MPRFIQICSAVLDLLLADRQTVVLKLIVVRFQHFVANALKRKDRPRVTAYCLCFLSYKQSRANSTTLHSHTTHLSSPTLLSPRTSLTMWHKWTLPPPSPASTSHFNCLRREHVPQQHTLINMYRAPRRTLKIIQREWKAWNDQIVVVFKWRRYSWAGAPLESINQAWICRGR